ncbi:hypothetical protein [Pantoea sp. KPR_PJ]|uniref:hypothetical protein n=1 Tax=Pantoea sp. KPR_PJ TaxID=2738375 RepID=UPI003527B7D8
MRFRFSPLSHATHTRQVIDRLFSPAYTQAKPAIATCAAGFVDLSDWLTFDSDTLAQLDLIPSAASFVRSNRLRLTPGESFLPADAQG